MPRILRKLLANRRRAEAERRRDRLAGHARVHRVAWTDIPGDYVQTACGRAYQGQDAKRRIRAGATSAKPLCLNCHREERRKP